jgi:hypothetical protein
MISSAPVDIVPYENIVKVFYCSTMRFLRKIKLQSFLTILN